MSFAPYEETITSDLADEVHTLARRLRGVRFAHLNSTATGGGVAEILRSLVPLMRAVGLDANWYVFKPQKMLPFFGMTKRVHHLLQGANGLLSEEERKVYLESVQEGARHLATAGMGDDVLFVHDPQLLPLAQFLNGAVPQVRLWVCHIDISHPNARVVEELLPFVWKYDGAVFSNVEYILGNLGGLTTYVAPPAIDPLSPKNVFMGRDTARALMSRMGIDPHRPVITQVSRFDIWKDPRGVVDAYRLARREVPSLQLVLMGVMEAQDDPDACLVLREVEESVAGDPDIHLIWDAKRLPDTVDRVVNALQTGSDVVLQKSLREGFGLTVAEAMWKGAAVIGGNVGGIRLQVRDGVSGFLVNSVEEAAGRIVELVRNPDLRASLGRAARESVRANFLMPRLLRDYLRIADGRVNRHVAHSHVQRAAQPQ